MAQVKLSIGGRQYELACRAGEEAHYEALAQKIDAKAQDVLGALGGVSETRLLLLASLLLADEIDSRPPGAAPPPPPAPAIDPKLVPLLEQFAERLEALGDKLEKAMPSA
ncbi:cell division protein ZapA [Sphingomonas vulcanisoli]|uniref:Cell division protein ZapA n=1 Tax=Sphingomonas vulcanisoli TaxID=1658060 RepID=A0ABX0TYS9_9SPHN|nr:cell division protein ZapA [Sphingomonas vulcanisoli]NIJ08905.1 cell division protein ZapA [Sphingomonas vulcanisoli]